MQRSLLFGTILLLLGLTFYNVGAGTIFFANDQALSFAVVREFLAGEPVLAGPPSHIGGRHLGPYFYWWLALPYWLGGGEVLRAVVITSIAQLLSIIPLFMLWRRLFPALPWLIGAAGLCFTLSLSYLDTIRIPWHPHLLLPLSTLFLLATFNVLQRGLSAVGPWLLSGSILVQTHIASAPLCAGVAAAVLVHAFRHSELWSTKQLSSKTLLWLLSLALSLAPALVYEFRYDGNIARLFAVHGSGPAVPAGFWQTLQSGAHFTMQFIFGSADQFQAFGAILKFVLAGIAVFVLALPLRQLCFRQPYFCLATVMGTAATALALSRFQAPLYDYYWSALLPLPALLGATFLAQLAGSKQWQKTTAIICAVYCIHSAFVITSSVQRYSKQPFLPYHTVAHSAAVAQLINQENPSNERVEVFPRLHAALARNSYYYFLGPEYFNAMEVSWKFKELSKAPKEEPLERSFKTKTAYLVICPKPYRSALKPIMNELNRRWVKVADFLPNEESFAGCFIRKIQRRESSAPDRD